MLVMFMLNDGIQTLRLYLVALVSIVIALVAAYSIAFFVWLVWAAHFLLFISGNQRQIVNGKSWCTMICRWYAGPKCWDRTAQNASMWSTHLLSPRNEYADRVIDASTKSLINVDLNIFILNCVNFILDTTLNALINFVKVFLILANSEVTAQIRGEDIC